MDPKIEVLKEFAESAFGSLERAYEGITEVEAEWRPMEESNNAKWILNHLSRITNQSIPRIVKGDPEWKPAGWPEDYREQTYSVEKLTGDIAKGKIAALEMLSGLKDGQLVEEIPLWGGTRQRKVGIFAYLGEIINHKGQIAMLRGNIKRRREKDSGFLSK